MRLAGNSQRLSMLRVLGEVEDGLIHPSAFLLALCCLLPPAPASLFFPSSRANAKRMTIWMA